METHGASVEATFVPPAAGAEGGAMRLMHPLNAHGGICGGRHLRNKVHSQETG